MNSLQIILIGAILCGAIVSARQHGDRPTDEMEQDEYSGTLDEAKHHNHGKERHRRKRYQTNYGYNYPVPANPMYYEHDRRDYDRQQDILLQIYRFIEEISAYVKRPQPPVYVPYPVQYPVYVPQPACNCQNPQPAPKPQPQPQPFPGNITFTNRYPVMSDPNLNWGLVEQDSGKSTGNVDYDEEISRPISFTPVQPSRPSSRKQPEVEHGSTQAGEIKQAPAETRPGGKCYVALVRCCISFHLKNHAGQRQKCFADLGCLSIYDKGAACEYNNVMEALNHQHRVFSMKN